MPNWTHEQSKAIGLSDSNLLVSAAAGSGKTAVLVERIIRIITEEMIDIDKLLIVTFTNAAAGEMRERILKALIEKIKTKPDNEFFLRRQITLLNKAYITTIHSFCIEVVRRNFHLIDIDPSFRIADTTERNIMIQESLEELMELSYKRADESFINLVEAFGSNREDVKLQELIYRIYSFIQSKPYPDKWLDELTEMFNITKSELENSVWTETIKKSIVIELNAGRNLINEAVNICDSINGPIEYKDALLLDLENIEGLLKSIKISLDNFYTNITNLSHSRFKSIKGQRKQEIDEILLEEVKNLRDQYKEKIISPIKSGISAKGVDEHLKQLNYMYPMMRYLYGLVKDFAHLYSEKKLEKGILDFNDLEHYALKVLENKDVQSRFSKHFEYIFVDEYQDSNIVQETIISRIKRDKNLFLVGDVKQSIYRFRMADPSLFIEKYEKFSSEDGNKDTKIILSKNFRSRNEILQGVNYVFKSIMTKELGEIDYIEEAFLNKGIDFSDIDDAGIDIDIIEKKCDDLDDIDDDIKEMSNIEVEAKAVAGRIKQLLGKKTYDPKLGDYREISYKDIVILLRATKHWSPIFMEVFIDEGIPVYCDDSAGYFDVIEVKVFLDLLMIIDNKRQDIPLLSAMRSQIGKFTTNDLICIRVNHKEGSFYEAIEKYLEDKNDGLKDRLEKFLKKINLWSTQVNYMKLDEFLWKILIDTGYYHYIGAMPGGLQRQANLRILVDRAEKFEKSTVNGLFNFIRFIDKLSKSGSDMSTAKTLGENENVVRIMSIHKSKGLEFSVVICPGLGKQFNLRDTYEDILLHKDLGLGPKFVDVEKRIYNETFAQMAIKRKMKIESLSEEMRILYVAVTRAVDKLILVGSVNDVSKESKKWCKESTVYNLLNFKCFIDWILCAVSKHPDGEVIRDLGQLKIDKYSLDNLEESRWNIRIINREEILLDKNEQRTLKNQYKEYLKNFSIDECSQYRETIEKRFNWKYRHNNAVKIPSKLSVTDIKKASAKNIDFINYSIPKISEMQQFIEKDKSFSSAERGTIIHFVMQHLDLDKIESEDNIKKQVQEMIIKELLTEEEAEVVDIQKIKKFYESNIGKRILNSSRVYRESPFVLRKKACLVIEDLDECDDELLIQGIIDCYFHENDNLILVDYKTDYIFDGKIENTINRYKVQMSIYKEALEKITGKKVSESYIYLFNIDEEVRI